MTTIETEHRDRIVALEKDLAVLREHIHVKLESIEKHLDDL